MMAEEGTVLEEAVAKGMEKSWRNSYMPAHDAFKRFSGSISEDVVSYLKAYDRWAKPQGWGEPRKAEILPVYLTGRALAFYETQSDTVRNDYKLLCKSLTDRFSPKLGREIALEALKNRVQGFKETSQELADDISRLARQAFAGENYTKEGKDELTKIEFLRALHPELAYAVRIGDQENKMTFDEVVERAAWLEATYQYAHTKDPRILKETGEQQTRRTENWRSKCASCR